MRKAVLASSYVIMLTIYSNESAYADPYYLTFETSSVVGSNGVVAANYIGKQYIFKVDFDSSASHVQSDGTIYYYSDLTNTDRFYVESVMGNYISYNDNQRYFAQSPQQYNFGSWSISDQFIQNVYGSGPTYGSFIYRTRISLYTESFDDGVAVDGFWYDLIAPSYPNSLLSTEALWMIYDRDYSPFGSEMFGTFWARLRDISSVNPLAPPPDTDPVPEPATMLLFGTGLAGLLATRRRTCSRQPTTTFNALFCRSNTMRQR